MVACDRPALMERGLALVGIFDGHCGRDVAALAADHLPEFFEGYLQQVQWVYGSQLPLEVLCEQALLQAITSLDVLIHEEGNRRSEIINGHCLNRFHHMGSTATVAVVHCGGQDRFVTVANLGDSRALLCRSGKPLRVSEEHTPSKRSERERIERAGGSVKTFTQGDCRVLVPGQPRATGLAVSRAFGDFLFKGGTQLLPTEMHHVIAVPEVCTTWLGPGDAFLLLGSDGLFELHDDEDLIGCLCGLLLRHGASSPKALEMLADWCCAKGPPTQSRCRGFDNISAIALHFGSSEASIALA